MDLQGPDFSDSGDPMIIFADSRDPIFNYRNPNRVPKTPLKTLRQSILMGGSGRLEVSSRQWRCIGSIHEKTIHS